MTRKNGFDWAEIDKNCSREISRIEWEFKVKVDWNYPLMKYNEQLDFILDKDAQERAAYKGKK